MLRAVPQWQPSREDRELEKLLLDLADKYNAAGSADEKRAIWRFIKEMHSRRSPEMVRYLEQKKGLIR